jgi:hypothetical protein
MDIIFPISFVYPFGGSIAYWAFNEIDKKTSVKEVNNVFISFVN